MNSSSSNRVSVQGPGAVSTLGIAFIVLKLTGVITWSWWLVLLPFLVPLVVGAVGGLLALIVAIIVMRR